MEQQSVLPWERPNVAMILSVFGGKVITVTAVSKQVKIGDDTNDIELR